MSYSQGQRQRGGGALVCPKCKTNARLTSQQHVYGRSYGKGGSIWICENFPTCDCYVGCHPGSTTPLGSLADKVTRTARSNAHGVFDRLWKEGHVSRNVAYSWARQEFGFQLHIGESDADLADRVRLWADQILRNLTTDTKK